MKKKNFNKTSKVSNKSTLEQHKVKKGLARSHFTDKKIEEIIKCEIDNFQKIIDESHLQIIKNNP